MTVSTSLLTGYERLEASQEGLGSKAFKNFEESITHRYTI